MMTGYTNSPKTALIWIAVFVFILTGLGAYAQQTADDAEVIFHVS